jgi:hypothetical protein
MSIEREAFEAWFSTESVLRRDEDFAAWEAWQARAALAEKPAAWISVADRMPTAGVKVLVFYRNIYGRTRRTCAHYSPEHTVDASIWDEGEPDETEDGTFEPEGWWEEPVEINCVGFIADEITHWMPLPAAPIIAAQEKGTQDTE